MSNQTGAAAPLPHEPSSPAQAQLYTATLVGGQTYVYNGTVFEHQKPEVIDQDTYDYLRTHARKSIKMGEDDETLRRVRQPYFVFKKIKAIVGSVPEYDDEEDDLEEIEMASHQMRPAARLTVREEAVDVDAAADDSAKDTGAPGARSRARRPRPAK